MNELKFTFPTGSLGDKGEEMDIKNISYSTIQSHVFPGIVLELQLLLALVLFSPVPVVAKLSAFMQANVSTFLAFGILFLVFATILGFILDGIHHFVFRKREKKIYGIYKYMTSMERLEIARSTLDEDLWYPYEAYANIAIAMLPGIALVPYWMWLHAFVMGVIGGTWVVYVVVLAIMWHEAIATLEQYKEVEKELLEAFKSPRPEGKADMPQATVEEP